MSIRDDLSDQYEDLVFMDEYDDCIIGVLERFGMEPIVIYDKSKVIERHIADGMSEEEAYEFFEFNQLGAWVGEQTPGFLEKLIDN